MGTPYNAHLKVPLYWWCREVYFSTIQFSRGAQIILGGKLRNPYFCHIFGMKNYLLVLLKNGIYNLGKGFKPKFSLNEKLGRCK